MHLREQLQASLGSAYTLERELGGGGMSRVFVAEETALGRKVVVKVLAPELAAGVSAERFQREIKLAAALQHPNIVPVHAAGVAGGLPYYTMPFVDGFSLRTRLSRSPAVPAAEAVALLKDVARALAYAHEHGVVHRDIKPENVLLSGDAAEVTDFGIAKALHASRTEAPGGTLTQVGTSLGTPAYMAPEQAAGDPATDHRADIYAFGCVGYELLTGRAPFAGKLPHQLFMAHAAERPKAVQGERPDCPPALASLIMRCLEKDPALRPQTAREMVQDLDSVSTPAAMPIGKLRPGTRRAIFAAGALAAVVVIAMLALSRGESVKAADRSLAVLPFENVGGDTANLYFADGMADELTTALSRVPGLKLASRSSAFRFRGTAVDVRDVGRQLGVTTVLEGAVRRAGTRLRVTAQLTNARDGTLLWTESYERDAKDVFAVQDDISRSIVSALQVRLADPVRAAASSRRGTDNLEAYDLYLRGHHLWYRRGGASLRRAIELFAKAIEKDPGFARAHAGLAMAYTTLPWYARVAADSVVPLGKAAGERAVSLDPELADAHLGLANALLYEFDWPQAERHLRRAVELEPDNPSAHQWLGSFLYTVGRIDEALPVMRRAAALDPLSAVVANDLAFTLILARQYDEAVETARRTIELDSTYRFARGNLLTALALGGKPDSALALSVSTDSRSEVVLAHVRAGRRAEAERELSAMRSTVDARDLPLLWAHAALGNVDSTLVRLSDMVNRHSGDLLIISLCAPQFDAVRKDPRYPAIAAQMRIGECRFPAAR